VEVISALFILLFAYTAFSKWLDSQNFIAVLAQSPLIGRTLAGIAAWSVIISELIICALLFIPRTRLIGLYGSFLVIAVFTLYIGYMIAFTPKLPCHCGGVISQMTWPQHLAFNIVFTMLALTGIILDRRNVLTHPRTKPATLLNS
jgi:hypothetical protein